MRRRVVAALGAVGSGLVASRALCARSDPNFDCRFARSEQNIPECATRSISKQFAMPPTSEAVPAAGEISTHVFSKLGKGSIEGAAVRVSYNGNLSASVLESGWHLLCERQLSANGGVDDLVPPGTLKRGLYLIEFDFTGVWNHDAHATPGAPQG